MSRSKNQIYRSDKFRSNLPSDRPLPTFANRNFQHSKYYKFPLLRFRSALHYGYSGITDLQDGLFFVLTRARTFKKARDSQQRNIRGNIQYFHSRPLSLSVIPL
jgi:hypothetical protein